jgi:hypothetical protein
VDGQFPLVSILKELSHGVTNTCGSDALKTSILECRLYAKHNIRKDHFIGGTKDAIELLLAEGVAGGLYNSC